jgi:hypothetical protein
MNSLQSLGSSLFCRASS